MDTQGRHSMHLYGYSENSNEDEPMAIGEVTVAASPATLRMLAEFLLYVAEKMDRHGSAFGHEHFSDYAREMRSFPAFIVVRDTGEGL